MPLKLSNNAIGTLVSSMTNSSTSVVLAPGQGTKFPVLESGDWFPITVVRASNPNQFEIMHATARSGDILTVTRAREGTTAITFSVGDVVEHRLTKDALDRDFVRLGPDSLEGARLSVSNDGSNLKTSVHAGGKEEQLVRQGDLGTAATRNVTTSDADTTSGRLLKTGDFGLGGIAVRLPVEGDWNDIDAGGVYMSSDAANAPWTGWIFVDCHKHNAQYVTQVAYSFTQPIPRMAIRSKTAGNWGAWVEVYHSGNFNPANYAASSHTHPWGQVTGKPATATRWPTWGEVTGKPTQAGAVGSYAIVIFRAPGINTVNWGDTVAGSNLAPWETRNTAEDTKFNPALSGTWRIMGRNLYRATSQRNATLAIRIS